ncbi:hypothetical protein BJV78DRAFT_1310784 [Lactifluus subvellereus]|nr:hypothetical protein BJV78DRAFT_1310784 [Lactifluus subvellereus]
MALVARRSTRVVAASPKSVVLRAKGAKKCKAAGLPVEDGPLVPAASEDEEASKQRKVLREALEVDKDAEWGYQVCGMLHFCGGTYWPTSTDSGDQDRGMMLQSYFV